MIVVCNSTPLIALAKINRLRLLKDFFSEISIPEEVYDEVVRRGGGLAGASEVASCKWICTYQVINSLAVDALCISLDKGEAEAIVLSGRDALLIIERVRKDLIAQLLPAQGDRARARVPAGALPGRVDGLLQSAILFSQQRSLYSRGPKLLQFKRKIIIERGLCERLCGSGRTGVRSKRLQRAKTSVKTDAL